MTEEVPIEPVQGFEHEIKLLRDLIDRVAEDLQKKELNLEQKLSMLETVGHAAPSIARMVKAQQELENSDLDPALLLRQALEELEKEWPEFQALCREFKPQSAKEEHGDR